MPELFKCEPNGKSKRWAQSRQSIIYFSNYFCALDVRRGYIAVSLREISPFHITKKAILSVENVITTTSYSRIAEREIKPMRAFTGSATLELWHNETYYLQSVGGRVDGENGKGCCRSSLCKPVASDFSRYLQQKRLLTWMPNLCSRHNEL